MLLKDKVAIVTGAALGIGAGIADLFAREGAHVYLLDLDGAKAEGVAAGLRGEGLSARAFACDVSKRETMEAAFAAAVESHGRIDVLINNAGIYPRRMFVDMVEPEWDQMMEVNLKSLFHTAKLALPHMIGQRSGKIVNISSVTIFVAPPKMTHYVTSKGGVIGFTRSLAREMGPHNIHVNSITPGAIKTEGEVVHANPADIEAILRQQCLARRILPLDVARVCLFLGSELSDSMTGQNLNVDGGLVFY